MHYITSNFNNLDTNYLWNNLKSKNKIKIDKLYNNFFFSLNDNSILGENEYFHILIYSNSFNYSDLKKKIIYLIKKVFNKNLTKNFHLYLIKEENENLNIDIKNLETISKLICDLGKFKKANLFIHLINNFRINNFSLRNEVLLKFPFDINTIKIFSSKINKVIKVSQSKPYKLIILDCDNTLWGGVLDESKIRGIQYSGDGIGKIYENFQHELKRLKNQGYILSISSKNNENAVWEAMKKRSMILNRKDFISPKINWDDKQINISNTLKELSLRPEDTVFIDDNILEIQKVKHYISNINTIHLKEISKIFDYLNKDFRFQKIKYTEEDKKKYEQYKIKSKFENLKISKKTSKSFYKNLKQKINFLKLNDSNFERCLQIFNKTNQFNFTLNRYNEVKLKKIRESKLFSVNLFNVRDKFGDHGLVGAYIIRLEKKSCKIVEFAMSCRVLSRKIEDYVIYKILKDFKNTYTTISYNKTSVNDSLISNFLKKNYFKLVNKKGQNFIYKISNTKELNETKKIFI